MPVPPLRRPWAQLAGCVWLPRLVDKVRLHFSGNLPPDFQLPFLHPLATDGAFLAHFALPKEELLEAVQASPDDASVATWFLSRPLCTPEHLRAWNTLAFHLGKPGYPVHRGFERQRRLLFGTTSPDPRLTTVFALLAWDENTWQDWLQNPPSTP